MIMRSIHQEENLRHEDTCPYLPSKKWAFYPAMGSVESVQQTDSQSAISGPALVS